MTRVPKLLVSIALVAIGAGWSGACAPSRPRIPGSVAPELPARLRVQVDGRVTVLSLEQYVLGAMLSEVTPVGESERVATLVYQVQAIIARTYAVAHVGRHAREGFDLCDQTHCQLYEPGRVATSRFTQAGRSAAVATAGRILRFDRRPAQAVFHSDCGGHTTSPGDAWGGPPLPYLPAAVDEVPEGTHRAWQFVATAQEWTAILRTDPRTDPGGALRGLRITRTDSSGRAAEVEIAGSQTRRVSGPVLRAVVSAARGERALMSTRFVIRAAPGGFRIDGTGFGHGVGLCQVGAIARIRRGDSVNAVLGHYYPTAR